MPRYHSGCDIISGVPPTAVPFKAFAHPHICGMMNKIIKKWWSVVVAVVFYSVNESLNRNGVVATTPHFVLWEGHEQGKKYKLH